MIEEARSYFAQLQMAAIADRRPLAIALAYVIMCNAALWWIGAPLPTAGSIWLNAILYLSLMLAWLTLRYCILLVKTRNESAILHSLAFLKAQLATAIRSAPMFFALILFMPTFSSMKGSIFRFNNYSWDPLFIAWDRASHGADPWLLLQPVLGYPLATYLLSVAYQLWLALIYVGVLLFLFRFDRPLLRENFLCGFFLSWAVIGTALAIIFASVGPCFVQPILGIDRFVEQTRYLQSVEAHYPILVNDVQQLLLERYNSRSSELGAGITAMPSMHVALACLFWLALRQLSRWWGYAGLAFLLVIMIGSVHLAWHYALDGYVSIAVMVLIWTLLRRWIASKHDQVVAVR